MKNLKRITLALTFGISLILLSGCTSQKPNTVSQNSRSQENTKPSTQSSSDVNQTEQVNKDAQDMVDYYNIEYKAPQNINKISGYYELPDQPESPVKIYPDGRYVQLDPVQASVPPIYFDSKNNVKQSSDRYYYLITRGRIVEKDGIAFLVPLSKSEDAVLDENGELNYLSNIQEKRNITENLKPTSYLNNYSFIKDGLFFDSAQTETSKAGIKKQSNPDLEKLLDKKPIFISEEGIPLDNLNYLYKYLDHFTKLPSDVVTMTPDELKSIDYNHSSIKFTLGFKYGDNSGYATDGKSVYTISIDQLGSHASKLY